MLSSLVSDLGFVEVEPFQFRESSDQSHVGIGSGGLFEGKVGDVWKIRK